MRQTAAAAAARQRRCRTRRRQGIVCVTIKVSELDLVDTLLAAKLIDPASVDDRDAVTAALERVIAEWCAAPVTRDDVDW